jgi:hypothetical protein
MRIRTPLLVCALALCGCQDRKAEPTPGVAVQPENPPPKGDRGAPEPGPGDPSAAPVAGRILGTPFKPDAAKLEGTRLEFRTGKDFIADGSISLDVPAVPGGKYEGKTWTFNGEFQAPVVFVNTRTGKDGLGVNEIVFGKDHTLTLTISKQTKTTISGTIDLKVKSLKDTHLTGAFTAEARKAATDPLDADDAPYVRGEIKFAGFLPEEMILAGFAGKGADGKEYSNSVGMPLYKDGKAVGGSGTSTTFAPQLTTLMGADKQAPEYRHTHLPPGDYVVYVKVGAVVAAWKRLTVKTGDTTTVDLTVDPKTFGEVTVTIPAEEAKAVSEFPLILIPAGMPELRSHYAFQAADVKKDQTAVTVKGVPAGKYRAVRGESEAEVEVVAGKSAAVTLARAKK